MGKYKEFLRAEMQKKIPIRVPERRNTACSRFLGRYEMK
jgi:hypothetical protein